MAKDSESWYTWDGLFTLNGDKVNGNSRRQHFLGRMAKFSGNVHSYHMWIAVNVTGIVIVLLALYVCYFHFDVFHYQLCNVYAKLGHAEAQHLMGERLLHGKGVEKDQVNSAIVYFLCHKKGLKLMVYMKYV